MKKILLATVAACMISSGAAAFPTDQRGLPVYNALPQEVRDSVEKARNACSEMRDDGGEYQRKLGDWAGIQIVDLSGDKSDDIVVDYSEVCGGPMTGAVCSNRACGFEIYKQISNGKWRKIFDESLYGRYLVIDWGTNRLQLMVATIYAGDPRCQPDPKKSYSSGQSCNLFVTYKGGRWNWQKIK
jgi:hypothetical protein